MSNTTASLQFWSCSASWRSFSGLCQHLNAQIDHDYRRVWIFFYHTPLHPRRVWLWKGKQKQRKPNQRWALHTFRWGACAVLLYVMHQLHLSIFVLKRSRISRCSTLVINILPFICMILAYIFISLKVHVIYRVLFCRFPAVCHRVLASAQLTDTSSSPAWICVSFSWSERYPPIS